MKFYVVHACSHLTLRYDKQNIDYVFIEHTVFLYAYDIQHYLKSFNKTTW